MINSFYHAFEDKFRGSRELIKHRLEVYLPFILPIRDALSQARAIDLGCGRGEWLELLASNGFNAQGVDLDDTMLSTCQALGLTVHIGDAIEFLQKTPDNSQAIVSGFHIAEHLPFPQLQSLIQEAHRVLIPGGLLILETPNPENFSVSTLSFYYDPTHLHPLPPIFLSFLTEFTGFKRNKILRLQESEQPGAAFSASLNEVFNGASPDYAVVAQKESDASMMALFDKPFSKEYGLKASTLIEKFDCTLKEQSYKMEALTALVKNLSTLAETNAAEIVAIRTSRSWRITAPLRAMSRMFRRFLRTSSWFAQGVWAWVTLKPDSRPRRMTRAAVLRCAHFVLARAMVLRFVGFVLARPQLTDSAKRTLRRLPPTFETKLRRIVLLLAPPPPDISSLSPRALEIHALLEEATAEKPRKAA